MNFRFSKMSPWGKNKEMGGAALEYVVVSMFGLVLSLAAIAFVSTVIDQKFESLEEAIGVEFDSSSFNPFKKEST